MGRGKPGRHADIGRPRRSANSSTPPSRMQPPPSLPALALLAPHHASPFAPPPAPRLAPHFAPPLATPLAPQDWGVVALVRTCGELVVKCVFALLPNVRCFQKNSSDFFLPKIQEGYGRTFPSHHPPATSTAHAPPPPPAPHISHPHIPPHHIPPPRIPTSPRASRRGKCVLRHGSSLRLGEPPAREKVKKGQPWTPFQATCRCKSKIQRSYCTAKVKLWCCARNSCGKGSSAKPFFKD